MATATARDAQELYAQFLLGIDLFGLSPKDPEFVRNLGRKYRATIFDLHPDRNFGKDMSEPAALVGAHRDNILQFIDYLKERNIPLADFTSAYLPTRVVEAPAPRYWPSFRPNNWRLLARYAPSNVRRMGLNNRSRFYRYKRRFRYYH